MACMLVFGSAYARTVYAGQSAVEICHATEHGAYQLITIADPAYDTHIAHGDKAVEQFFIDADGDGFGSSSMTVADCHDSEGFVADNTDCDDSNPAVHPGAQEIEDNGINDDCNLDTPDSNTPKCPCEGITSHHITWDASFQTESCFIQYHGHPVVIYDTTTTRVGVLAVFTQPLWEQPSWCVIGGAIDEYYVELRLIAPTTAEEHQACVQSLTQIAASDGVTCP